MHMQAIILRLHASPTYSHRTTHSIAPHHHLHTHTTSPPHIPITQHTQSHLTTTSILTPHSTDAVRPVRACADTPRRGHTHGGEWR